MKILGIIPARYGSSRFPGKPLVDLAGKPMVWHVYNSARQALDNVVIATDDQRIFSALTNLGAKVVMTSDTHRSGTERCAEAASIFARENFTPDIVINIQGDEPLIPADIISQLANAMDCKTQIGTLIRHEKSAENLFNPNVVKVVRDNQGNAIYFSRQPIPYLRDTDKDKWTVKHRFFSHIGIYAYTFDVLQEIVKLPAGILENAEKLEQLRWIEYGYKIKTIVTDYKAIGVDTPEDLEKIRQMLQG